MAVTGTAASSGRLASAGYDGIAEAEYLYNALGQQVQRTVSPSGNAVVTLSVHDLNGNRIAEYDGAGTLLREYLWLDGRPLAVVEDGNTYWLHWDHILRPVMATDAAGTVVWAARYLPFGGIDEVSVDTGVLTQNLRFPGQWFQAETGLHQNWMRDYDPTTGRYLQADPLGLVDGASVYGYVSQNPLRYIDPSGRAERGAAIGATIGLGVGTAAGGLVGGAGGLVCGPGAGACVPAGATGGAAAGGFAGAIIGAIIGSTIEDWCMGAEGSDEDSDYCDQELATDMAYCGSMYEACMMIAKASPNPAKQRRQCGREYGYCKDLAWARYMKCLGY